MKDQKNIIIYTALGIISALLVGILVVGILILIRQNDDEKKADIDKEPVIIQPQPVNEPVNGDDLSDTEPDLIDTDTQEDTSLESEEQALVDLITSEPDFANYIKTICTEAGKLGIPSDELLEDQQVVILFYENLLPKLKTLDLKDSPTLAIFNPMLIDLLEGSLQGLRLHGTEYDGSGLLDDYTEDEIRSLEVFLKITDFEQCP